jgi:homoprotocatechuate degradation regulator HpaR
MDAADQKKQVNVRLRSFSRSLPMSLLLAREAVMNRFRGSLKLFNITEQQWRVLRALTSVEEIEVMELARVTYLLSPSLSRIVRDLEARKLIMRRTVPEDMRRSLISISPQGFKLIEAVAPYSESIYSEIAETFGSERMEKLQGLLKELTDALHDLPQPDYSRVDLGAEVSALVSAGNRGRPRRIMSEAESGLS